MVRTSFVPPSPDTPVSETVIDVRTSELDSFGHVNHAVYLTYFEHARFRALSEAGFAWGVLAERGWAIFVVRIEVDYLAEAKREDQLLIRTWADSFRRTSMILAQEMVRADDPHTVVARARVTAAWIGPDRKPMRVPPEVREGLSGRPADASSMRTPSTRSPDEPATTPTEQSE
jgi:YbgC/YbaW family acyl-CoA thioester hydrolase